MAKYSHILGMNARNQVYCLQNSQESKKFGFSKIKSKQFLKKHGIGVADVYAIISSQDHLRGFDWSSIPGGFAIKPSNGSAGKGVLVIKGKGKKAGTWKTINNETLKVSDLALHISDILDGQYSTWGATANAIIEERVPNHPDLEPYVPVGTPDVRVIVYNNIPVMAMARLPTHESEGRANLDRGAIGLGLDMGTGKSVRGVQGKKHVITEFPHSHLPVTGVQIPNWTDVLKTAVRSANATGLTYMGCDIFLHPDKGPLVAEVNAFPGLSIQIANKSGLRRRLQKLDDIEARNVNHAVRIGQSLFAETYPAVSLGDVDVPILSPIEEIDLFNKKGEKKHGMAVVNTGKTWSVIAANTAEELGLTNPSDILWNQYVEGEGKTYVVDVKFQLHTKTIKTSMVVSKKLNTSKYVVHIGKRDLGGFLVSGEQR